MVLHIFQTMIELFNKYTGLAKRTKNLTHIDKKLQKAAGCTFFRLNGCPKCGVHVYAPGDIRTSSPTNVSRNSRPWCPIDITSDCETGDLVDELFENVTTSDDELDVINAKNEKARQGTKDTMLEKKAQAAKDAAKKTKTEAGGSQRRKRLKPQSSRPQRQRQRLRPQSSRPQRQRQELR